MGSCIGYLLMSCRNFTVHCDGVVMKMTEYVERETAIKALMNDAPEQVGYSREDAADCIRYMDAVDVAQARHGRWDKDGCCTVCGEEAIYYWERSTHVYTDYCPNCGAKMDLEDTDGR